MAIAMTENDKGISTIPHSFFNTDRAEHAEIDTGFARSLIDFEVKTEPVCRPNGQVVPDVYSLVRTDTDTVLPIGKTVGKEFTPVQHVKMFDFLVDEILPRTNGEMKLETVSTMYGGAASLVTTQVGGEFHLPNDQSGIFNRICFSNPMGKGSLLIGWTSVRIVCQNTLAKARREMCHSDFAFKIQHSTNSNYYVETALESIKAQVVEAMELRKAMTFLAEKEVSGDTVKNVLDAVYPLVGKQEGRGLTMAKNAREEVLRQFESGETAQTMDKKTGWSLFNSFTYPIIHAKTNSRLDGAEIEYSSMMGNRADRIADIFGKTMEAVRLAA